MAPQKLGYAEIHYGTTLNKIVPVSIPNLWFTDFYEKANNPFVREMKLFLADKLNPESNFKARSEYINKQDAINHLTSIKNSYLLTNAEKLGICSFLSSMWFRYVDIILND